MNKVSLVMIALSLVSSSVDSLAATNDTKNQGDELIQASRRGDLDAVRRLLKSGVDPSTVDWSGGTPLMWAAKEGHADVVRTLLDAEADPEQIDPRGWTPLMIASIEGHASVISTLIEAGVQVNRTDSLGVNALMRAAENGKRAAIVALLNGNARVDARSGAGDTAEMLAERNGHSLVAQVLSGDLEPTVLVTPPVEILEFFAIEQIPRQMKTGPPVYPELARKAGLEGTVYIEFIVGSDGKVGNVNVLQGPQIFRQAAIDAIRKWKFEPAMLNEKAVAVRMTQSVIFKLSDPKEE